MDQKKNKSSKSQSDSDQKTSKAKTSKSDFDQKKSKASKSQSDSDQKKSNTEIHQSKEKNNNLNSLSMQTITDSLELNESTRELLIEDLRKKTIYKGNHNQSRQREGYGEALLLNESLKTFDKYYGQYKANKRHGHGTYMYIPLFFHIHFRFFFICYLWI